MRNIEKELFNRMDGYYYGQMNLLKNDFQIEEAEDELKIKNFYSGPNKVEVCHNQSDFYKKSNRDLNLIRVYGTEPVYFNDEGSKHIYLLYLKKELNPDFWYWNNLEMKNYLIENNPLIVDPSFKKVIPFSNSGYEIKVILNNFYSPTDLDMENNKSVPLGISKNKELVSLSLVNENLFIFFDKKFETDPNKFDYYKIDDFALRVRIKNERFLRPIIKNIHEEYKNYKKRLKLVRLGF